MPTGHKRLLLIRHAHAEDPPSGGADSDRSLSGRGEVAARALGEWLVSKGLRPDRVLLSSARRTVQTAEAISAAFDAALVLEARDELYLASPQTLAELVCAASEELRVLAVVVHNPGVWEYAERLAKRSGRFVGSYSPATCAVFELEGRWSEFAGAAPTLIAERRG